MDSGGLELIFNKRRRIEVTLPAPETRINGSEAATGEGAPSSSSVKGAASDNKTSYTIADLVDHLVTREMKDPVKSRSLLVSQDGTVRPGILVLINETDWELEGEAAYVLQEGDKVMFVSTLHGG